MSTAAVPSTVLVLGASGTAGRAAIPLLVAAGHHVRAHVRCDGHERLWPPRDVRVVRGDATSVEGLRPLLRGVDAVIDVRVRIPSAARAALPWAWRDYVRIRDRLTGVLVDAALAQGVPRVVHDTVTMVYADGGDAWLDEDAPVDARGANGANLATERHLRRLTAHGGVGVALRFAHFYSGHDPFSLELIREARRGRSLVLGEPAAWHSAIHVDDAGSALVHALGVPAGVYNVADDEPLRRGELGAMLAAEAGVESLRGFPSWVLALAPAPVQALARSHRVSAARFRDLGWAPQVPSRRVGWARAFA